jgi:gliding motility-associated-like protein
LNKYLKIGLLLSLVWWAQSALAQDTIPVNTYYSFEATNKPGYTYTWWYTDKNETKTYFTSTSHKTEEILWDSEGSFDLFVQAKDQNNCLSEIITKPFVVLVEEDTIPIVYAGPDTIIGSCQPYVFANVYPNDNSNSYSWQPVTYLDNPNIPNPVFNPVETTTYELTVTTPQGISASDYVTITVSEIVAEAGENVYMSEGSTAILDASASTGKELQYNWTTISGTIDSGENTPNPIISGFGVYYLEIADQFNCISKDSVVVIRITQAPIANDDYDTTAYVTEVKIPVLDNDYDPENSLDPTTLRITLPPFNGEAYVDNNDYTINYRPNDNFTGSDNFEYQICNAFDKCDEANVYVLVTDYLFVIPNAFSPNGDNINDYFEILGIENYEGNTMTIYNRWGAKVYEAQNYGISSTLKFWNGIANTNALGNEEVPTGTYYYILDLGNGEKAISGSVYIDR